MQSMYWSCDRFGWVATGSAAYIFIRLINGTLQTLLVKSSPGLTAQNAHLLYLKNIKFIKKTDNNDIMFHSYIAHTYYIQMASLCARGIITPALALMQPFSANSIRRNKFLLGTHLLHLGQEGQMWTKCLV